MAKSKLDFKAVKALIASKKKKHKLKSRGQRGDKVLNVECGDGEVVFVLAGGAPSERKTALQPDATPMDILRKAIDRSFEELVAVD
ncbi:hypothetical protein HK097_011645 [Rhizophlyctis rosea]|uniref:Uncharacterized protein n=1 Tax=Rhizophlyctis rosea TaxID=64517 RepID=A0AAD5S8H9_9FUNG|nr:hypothetical protein HK097_011645 [Rhizophlyctis rosea]